MRPNKLDIYETTEEGGTVAAYAQIVDGWAYWSDTTHHRAFQVVRVTRDTPKEFAFIDERGAAHFLRVIDRVNFPRLCKALRVTDPKIKDPGQLKVFIRRMVTG